MINDIPSIGQDWQLIQRAFPSNYFFIHLKRVGMKKGNNFSDAVGR